MLDFVDVSFQKNKNKIFLLPNLAKDHSHADKGTPLNMLTVARSATGHKIKKDLR